MNFSFDKIAPPVAFTLVGFIMVLAGVFGVIPIGNPQPTIVDPFLKAVLVVLGVLLIAIGPLFFWREMSVFRTSHTGEQKSLSSSISIIEPKDWSRAKPKRKKNTEYTISPIKGIVTGKFGSVYLVYRVAPSGDLRVSERLIPKDDGAWSGSVKISGWDNNKDYEILAIGYLPKLDLSIGTRINETPEMVTSNSLYVHLEYEPEVKQTS
jgi:hypothetical protein